MQKLPDSTPRDALALLIGLLLFELALVGAYLVDVMLDHPIKTLSAFINLDDEATLPNWFSTTQLFLIGAVFWRRGRQTLPFTHPSRTFWYLAAAVFVFLSLDEAAAVHEKMTHVLKQFFWVPRFNGDHGIWIPFYVTVSVVAVIATKSQLQAIWKQGRHEFILMGVGALVFLAGAVGLEIISYQYLREGAPSMWYHAEVALEELFEMSGASLILYGAIQYSRHAQG